MRAILTDIEGTTSSIAFVKDVLFPYARREMPRFLAEQGDRAEVRRWISLVAAETGLESVAEIASLLKTWIDRDRKHTALKALQGLLWEVGYTQGDYRAHIYADAAAALRQWHDAGHDLYVYSSGSVPAQKLFFAHSEAGDLTPLFSGYFDTEIGGKRERESYRRIAQQIDRAPVDVLFLSDVVEELDAARAAGMRTVLLDRSEDYPQPRLSSPHPRVTSFAAITADLDY